MTSHHKTPTATGHETPDAEEDFQCQARCPFCAIAACFLPIHPLDDPQRIAQCLDPDKTNPASMVIYSGEHVLAFLDIQPLTWGHTLVIPRRHRVKMGDLEALDAAEIGRHLPLITRAVMRAVFDLPYNPETLKLEGGDYNIVQNNGPLAAQVVPHMHHHIIPRGPDTHLPQMTTHQHASWTMFGRGYRTDLDGTDPETQRLVQRMRYEIALEFTRGDIEQSYSTSDERNGVYDVHGNKDNDEDLSDRHNFYSPHMMERRADHSLGPDPRVGREVDHSSHQPASPAAKEEGEGEGGNQRTESPGDDAGAGGEKGSGFQGAKAVKVEIGEEAKARQVGELRVPGDKGKVKGTGTRPGKL